MSRASVTLDEEHEDIIADLQERRNIDVRAEAIRICIEEHADVQRLETKVHELRDELQSANSRIDASNEDSERVDALVRARKTEVSLAERKARANWFTRQKWRLLGVPDDED